MIPRYARWSLYVSIALLFLVFIPNGSFQPLYYVLWVLGVGGYVYRNHERIQQRFQSWNIGPFKKFLGIGIGVILLEEMFAALAMHGFRYLTTVSLLTYPRDVLQFWALNLLALPGMIIAWYLLLKRYAYTKREIFVLAGLFGLFAEKVHEHLVSFPLAGLLLIAPTMFTYGVIILIPTLSLDHTAGRQSHWLIRYGLGLIVPFICSIPGIGILSYLFTQNPGLFPPFGYFQ